MSGSSLSPINLLGALATREHRVKPGLRHLEIHTLEGLLGVLWRGPERAGSAVILCGGGMGGFLGPGDALYPWLGDHLADAGIATLRVDYRRPSRLEPCVLDAAAAAELAGQCGATRFVTIGHSFGGAVALNTALALPSYVKGVLGLATQSAGCESAAGLQGRPLLLIHGDADEVLSPQCSTAVARLAGHGDVVVLPGEGHMLDGAGPWLRDAIVPWVLDVLGGLAPNAPRPDPTGLG